MPCLELLRPWRPRILGPKVHFGGSRPHFEPFFSHFSWNLFFGSLEPKNKNPGRVPGRAAWLWAIGRWLSFHEEGPTLGILGLHWWFCQGCFLAHFQMQIPPKSIYPIYPHIWFTLVLALVPFKTIWFTSQSYRGLWSCQIFNLFGQFILVSRAHAGWLQQGLMCEARQDFPRKLPVEPEAIPLGNLSRKLWHWGYHFPPWGSS